MKNALLLLVAAGVLFALSAGLSLWLNQPKQTEEAVAAPKPAAKKAAEHAEPGAGRESEHGAAPSAPRSQVPAIPFVASDDPAELARMARQLQADLARVALREAEFAQQQESYRVVVDDIRDEMVMVQRIYQQRAAGLIPPAPRPPDGPKPPAPTPPVPKAGPADPPAKKPLIPDGPDPRNVSKVTGISESMPPEAAARIIEQMAKSGKMDLAVQLLARMNARHAAKILAAVSDEKLSIEIIERLLEARAAPKPAAGAP